MGGKEVLMQDNDWQGKDEEVAAAIALWAWSLEHEELPNGVLPPEDWGWHFDLRAVR